jgi:hypothetical protein
LKFRVGEEREIQLVLDAEFRLVFDPVRAAPKDVGVGSFKLLDGVTKLGRFRRSTGSVGLGEEKQDKVLPLVIFQRNSLALIGANREVRSFVTFFKHVAVSLCPRFRELGFG